MIILYSILQNINTCTEKRVEYSNTISDLLESSYDGLKTARDSCCTWDTFLPILYMNPTEVYDQFTIEKAVRIVSGQVKTG